MLMLVMNKATKETHPESTVDTKVIFNSFRSTSPGSLSIRSTAYIYIYIYVKEREVKEESERPGRGRVLYACRRVQSWHLRAGHPHAVPPPLHLQMHFFLRFKTNESHVHF